MTPNQKMKEAERLYLQAFELASEALEESALAVMARHPKITMFGASMGTATFYSDTHSISEDWHHTAGKRAENAVLKWDKTICARFDDMFRNCYRPCRIKRGGEIERDW